MKMTTIKILGDTTIKVKFCKGKNNKNYLAKENAYGLWVPDKKVIYIDTNRTIDYPVYLTIAHELTHAYLDTLKFTSDTTHEVNEEVVCELMAYYGNAIITKARELYNWWTANKE